MHHKSIGASLAQIGEIEAAILVHHGVTVSIMDVFEVGEGVNGSAHYVALDTEGRRWGLKASVRGIRNGTEREVLLAQIGTILGVPNSCPSHLCAEGALLSRSTQFSITEWLRDAKQLFALDANERDSLANSMRFARQFGEWLAFGMLLGVQDRHDRNWVWVPGTDQLAMIDTEDSLATAAPPSIYHIFRDYVGGSAAFANALAEVQSGVADLYNKYRARQAAVTHVLAHATFSAPGPTVFTALYPDAPTLYGTWATFYGF